MKVNLIWHEFLINIICQILTEDLELVLAYRLYLT